MPDSDTRVLYAAILTTPNGEVSDVCLYPIEACARDTINDSPLCSRDYRATLVKLDDDGNADILDSWVVDPA